MILLTRTATRRLAGRFVALCARSVRVDHCAAARDEAGSDQRVVTLPYRPTNPDPPFTLNGGTCQSVPERQRVSADVLGRPARDAARRALKSVLRFDLGDLPCRTDGVVTHTAPSCFIDVPLPAAP